MSKPGDSQSIWKKEITLRRKPKKSNEKGARVPAAPDGPARPDSIAELLRPLAEQTIDPVFLPPVTPQATAPPVGIEPAGEEVVTEARAIDEPASEEAQERERGHAPEAGRRQEPEHGPDPEHGFEAERDSEPEREPQREPQPIPSMPGGSVGQASGSAFSPEVELLPLEPELPTVEAEAVPAGPTRRERRAARRAAKESEREERRRARNAAEDEREDVPPRHKKLVGLKIGGSQLAAVEVVNKGAPRAVRMARMPLERGIVVGGELREPEELSAALKTFFRQNKLPRTCVRLGISNTRIGVRTFEISGIDDPTQLANAIRFRAQEALPIPLDEAVLDYRILEERVGEDGVRSRRVLLVVAHRELVDRYVTACRKAGVKLVGIDLEAFALLRALGDPTKPPAAGDDAGLVCISIGYDRSTLAVSNGHVCEFSRVLAWGGSSLDAAVARVLDLTPSEVEPVRHELSLVEEGEAAGLDAHRADQARAAMGTEVEGFARELVASLRFYQEQPGSLGIGEILLTGGTAACPGLAEELERLIGVAVRVADPLGRLKLPRKLRGTEDGSTGSLAIAVGLGIED